MQSPGGFASEIFFGILFWSRHSGPDSWSSLSHLDCCCRLLLPHYPVTCGSLAHILRLCSITHKIRSEFLTLNSSFPQPGPSPYLSGTFSSYSLTCTSSLHTHCVASRLCLHFPLCLQGPKSLPLSNWCSSCRVWLLSARIHPLGMDKLVPSSHTVKPSHVYTDYLGEW